MATSGRTAAGQPYHFKVGRSAARSATCIKKRPPDPEIEWPFIFNVRKGLLLRQSMQQFSDLSCLWKLADAVELLGIHSGIKHRFGGVIAWNDCAEVCPSCKSLRRLHLAALAGG